MKKLHSFMLPSLILNGKRSSVLKLQVKMNGAFIAVVSTFLYLLMAQNTAAQTPTCNLRIHAKNSESGKGVKEAEVMIDILQEKIHADMNGFMMARLPKSYYLLKISAPGYDDKHIHLVLQTDTTLIVQMRSGHIILEEIHIAATKDERFEMNQTGLEIIRPGTLKTIPSLGGERDPVKAATLLPGIQSGSEGSSDIVVRGGGTDQNLFLLDNAVLYHTNDLYGFLSTYNPLVIEKFNLYKSGFPSRFGGRLSSVIDVETVNPSMEAIKGSFALGTVSAGGTVEGPVIKEKLSWLVSGRRTYYDALQHIFARNDERSRESFNFYDFLGKVSYKPSRAHHFFVNIYNDRDIYFDLYDHEATNDRTKLEQTWKNRLLNFQWDWAPNHRIYNRLNIYNSRYQMKILDSKEKDWEFYKHEFNSSINDITLKNHFQYALKNASIFYGGTELSFIGTDPASVHYVDNEIDLHSRSLSKNEYMNSSFYLGHEFNWKFISASTNLRSNIYRHENYTFHNVEPRLSVSYLKDTNTSLKLSYSRISQPLHLLTNPGLGFPVNLWLGFNDYMTPQISDQISLGMNKSRLIGDHTFNLIIEGYYKSMENITAYKDGHSSNSLTGMMTIRKVSLEQAISTGNGHAYGMELFLQKTSGDFTGWLSYSLAWAKNRFKDINMGKTFPSPFDQRHNISSVASYKISPKWQINGSWMYSTGRPVTIPLYFYPTIDVDHMDASNNLYPYHFGLGAVTHNSARNAYRMKAFHKLDLAVQRNIKATWFKGYAELGLYNAYNRKNPFYYYLRSYTTREENVADRKTINEIRSVSLFPIIPSLSLIMQF